MTIPLAVQGIDPLIEDIIPPIEVPGIYPRNAKGRKVHVSKVYRDMKHGCHGVVLESIRTPRLATSRQAVARFIRRLTEVARSQDSPATAQVAQHRGHRDIEQELDQLGI